ncbi:MAG: ABC-type Mn2+/Zn2+ transport system permease subunit [Pseudoalteromonas tetraodonis]|jgi:ABC-type Mn2+/Zn2+ transport system permease subunit/Mn-dependent DtxR family transcriptional regulator
MKPRAIVWLLVLGFLLVVPEAEAARATDVVETDWGEQVRAFFSLQSPVPTMLGGALLLGLSCGLLGSFIVVRRMALMGDTLSHAVLPGVALGFMWSMSKNPVAMLVGATAVGLFGTVVVSWILRTTRIKQDAALGIVLATFYAFGVCMIRMIQNRNTGNSGGLDGIFFGDAASLRQQDVLLMLVLTVLTVLLLAALYRPFLVISFDPGFARSAGLPVALLDHVMMMFLAFAIVVALQAVGVVLVSALLITPAATAYLMTDRLHRMLLISGFIGMFSAALGVFLSFLGGKLPSGPFMVLAASFVFATAYLFAPRHGTLTRWWRRKNRSRQIRNENTLKAIYRVLEDRGFKGEGVTLQELAELRRDTLEVSRSQVQALVKAGAATTGENGNVAYLTPDGQQRGWAIVRNHRLWELYLTNLADYEPDHVHDDAEKIEHILGEDAVRELEKLLDYPETDPHGKQIPKVPRKTVAVAGQAGYGGGGRA